MRDFSKALRCLRASDPLLRSVIRRVGPCTFKTDSSRSLFEALVTAIAHQQLHGKAAQTILARFVDLYKVRRGSFPSARQVASTSLAKLRSVGFSESKARAILDIAEKTVRGEVPNDAALKRMGDEEIIQALLPLRGVGRWTAEMFLIFTLGRMDIFPADDFGVREGFRIAAGQHIQLKPKALAEYACRFAPFRTIAAHYFWRVADIGESSF